MNIYPQILSLKLNTYYSYFPKHRRERFSMFDNLGRGSFTNYVMPSRWVGGQQNITIANFTKVDNK